MLCTKERERERERLCTHTSCAHTSATPGRARVRARTHTHTHTHRHARTHTHTCARATSSPPSWALLSQMFGQIIEVNRTRAPPSPSSLPLTHLLATTHSPTAHKHTRVCGHTRSSPHIHTHTERDKARTTSPFLADVWPDRRGRARVRHRTAHVHAAAVAPGVRESASERVSKSPS